MEAKTMPRNECPNCGATLRKDAAFCRNCGQALTPEARRTSQPIRQPPPQQKCPQCGNSLKGTEQFCTKCGAKLVSTPSPALPVGGPVCPECGYSNNPVGSLYCIQCGRPLPEEPITEESESPAEVPPPEEIIQSSTCPSCGHAVKPGAKFCVSCGFELASSPIPSEIEDESDDEEAVVDSSEIEESIAAIPVPAEVLGQLIARGHQLSLEEQYTKSGKASEELLESLGDTAESGVHPLEDLLDTYIRERSEQERLEGLHETGEVSKRVYDRLNQEYNEKLSRMDEEIQTGITKIKGYLAQLRSDQSAAQDQLETIETRIEIGDMEGDPEKQQATLSEKIQRLGYAIAAIKHILDKEATIHGDLPSRFEVTETSQADLSIDKTESDENSDSEDEESEPQSTPTPSSDTEAGKICSNCGRVTASGSFCVHCGSPL
jgi:predicted nucleic acid-binding Zn ribbon protein